MDTKGVSGGGWDGLGYREEHIYTIDAVYKIYNCLSENLLYSTGNLTQCSVVT